MLKTNYIRTVLKTPVMFLPDLNLGNYVKQQTGRENMKIWQGTCIVHATFPARRLAEAKAEHPRAKVVAHPECPESVLAMADFIGSTSALIEWCVASDAPEFIVMTESGVNHSLRKLAPGKQFYQSRVAVRLVDRALISRSRAAKGSVHVARAHPYLNQSWA